jgi:hypothetical protein
MEMFSLGIRATVQKAAAFCTRYKLWDHVSSVIMPIELPFPLQFYLGQLHTILSKMQILSHLHHKVGLFLKV